MNRWNLWLIVVVMVLISVGTWPVVAENDAPDNATPPKARADKHEQKQHPAKVRGDWNKLDLSPDQATQIAAIQADTLEKIKQLRKAEHERILALLNDEQREHLDDIQAMRQAKMSVGGMKGALARMENKLDAITKALDRARQAGDQDKITKLEKQQAQQQAKVDAYRAKVRQAQAEIDDFDHHHDKD